MKKLLRYVTEACYEHASTVNFYSAYAPIKRAGRDQPGRVRDGDDHLGLHESSRI